MYEQSSAGCLESSPCLLEQTTDALCRAIVVELAGLVGLA
jgi:hypothetical protein